MGGGRVVGGGGEDEGMRMEKGGWRGGGGRVIQFPGKRIDFGNTVCDLQLYMCSLM